MVTGIWRRIAVALVLLAGISSAGLADGRKQSGGKDEFPPNRRTLSAPMVQPPIYVCAQAVAVYGFIPGASLDVYANGVHHVGHLAGGLKTMWPSTQVVHLTRMLKLNESITATETYKGVTSGQSLDPVIVLPDPTLTTPVLNPELWQCGQVVDVNNLRPSTQVDIIDVDSMPPNQVIGSGQSTSTGLAVFTSKLVLHHRITAVQMFCPGTPQQKKSPPAARHKVNLAPNPPNAPTMDAPVPGANTIVLHKLLVGALVETKLSGSIIENNGWANAHDNVVPVKTLPPSIPAGQPRATQALCKQSKSIPAPPAATSLPPITLNGPICPGAHFVTVWGVEPGAQVVLVRGGMGIGYGNGSIVSVGDGITLNAGDDLFAKEYLGSLSVASNHVTVGCDAMGNVVTQHNDNGRTGLYSDETTLTSANVLAQGMTQVRQFAVTNGTAVRAQPLYVRRVAFTGGDANGLFICDTANGVFAYNADTGAVEWSKQLADSKPKVRPVMCGIETTPVIDPAANRIYVSFYTANETATSTPSVSGTGAWLAGFNSAFWVVALDIRTGAEVSRVKVAGSGFRNDGTPLSFDPRLQRNHASLLLEHGVLYIAFCSIAPMEWAEFHGWVMAYRAVDLSRLGSWCSSPNFKGTAPAYTNGSYTTQGGAGIWEGGGGLSADVDGNVYFNTGNGVADPPNDYYGDSLIKLTLTPGGLIPLPYIPPDNNLMFEGDADLGAGGTMVLPSTDQVIGGGKTGYMFLLNSSTMALAQPRITAATSQYSDDNAVAWRYQSFYTGPHFHGSPTYWRGPDPRYGYFYVWAEKDYLRQYKYDTVTNKVVAPAAIVGSVEALDSPPSGPLPASGPGVSPGPLYTVMPGGMASVSSSGNNTGTGILWSTLPHNALSGSGTPEPGGHLYAFDAATLDPLWDGAYPALGHWVPPTIADGHVYIGTGLDYVIEYGLGPAGKMRHRKPWQPRAMITHMAPMAHMRMEKAAIGEAMMFLPAQRFAKLQPPKGFVQKGVLEGEGTISYRPTRSGRGIGSLQVRGTYLPHRALTPTSNDSVLRLSGGGWSSGGARVSSSLVRTVPAPDSFDAPWVLYRVTRPASEGLLAGVEYIAQAFTQGGGTAGRQPQAYHAQLILYRRQ